MNVEVLYVIIINLRRLTCKKPLEDAGVRANFWKFEFIPLVNVFEGIAYYDLNSCKLRRMYLCN